MKIAIQEKGRLAEGSKALLARAGFEGELFPVRDDDIPMAVAESIPFGIVGKDVYWNWVLSQQTEPSVREIWTQASQRIAERPQSNSIDIYRTLGFHRCSLMIAVPKTVALQGRPDGGWIANLHEKIMATSFGPIVDNFLTEKKVKPKRVIEIAGKLEMLARELKADAILEIVDSGATLKKFGWVPVYEVMRLEPVLIGPAYARETFPARENFLKALQQIEGVRVPRPAKPDPKTSADIYADGRGELSHDVMIPYLQENNAPRPAFAL